LIERFDVSKCKHKPLSIHRQEGRRVLEQFFEVEGSQLAKPERDRLIEDILVEAVGFGPLEELFRDEGNKEVMVLAATQVIARKKDAWMPTSVRFRDAVQFRGCMTRWAELGTPVATGTTPVSGFDVRLSNGFRAIGIVPPDILEQPPLVLFTRIEMPTGGSSVVPLTAATRLPGSGPIPVPVRRTASQTTPTRIMPAPDLGDVPDQFARLRQRVSSWIVSRCAAAGVYDLGQIPAAELQKVIHAHLVEVCEADRLTLDANTTERLVLEILAGINR